MFTKKITDADEFISLPSSTQALYLHLCMSADDDGFNNQIQMAMFKAHASIDDVKVLLTKRFILQFENGVIVIKHWRMANALRKDRYTETAYKEELKRLKIKDNGAYTLADESWLPNGCQMVAADKNSIDKNSIDNNIYGDLQSPDESKKELKKKKEQEANDIFERLWKLYPKKKGKGGVSQTQKNVIAKIGYEKFARYIELYKAEIEKNGTEEQFIMYGSTFFNSGYKDYLDENYETTEKIKASPAVDDRNAGLEKYNPTDYETNDRRREEGGWYINDDGYWIHRPERVQS